MSHRKQETGLAETAQPARIIPEIPNLPPIMQPEAVGKWDLHDGSLTPRQVHEGPAGAYGPSYDLVFSDGRRVPCARRCVVGRMPKQPGENYDAYLVVDDPSQQTSRRHFEFGVTSIGQVWAMDLGSANGTFVLSNGTYVQLPEKKRTVLADNDVIRFGGLSAKVERRADRG